MKTIFSLIFFMFCESAIAADIPLVIRWEIVINENGVLSPWKEMKGTFTEVSQLALQCEQETGKLCLARKKK